VFWTAGRLADAPYRPAIIPQLRDRHIDGALPHHPTFLLLARPFAQLPPRTGGCASAAQSRPRNALSR